MYLSGFGFVGLILSVSWSFPSNLENSWPLIFPVLPLPHSSSNFCLDSNYTYVRLCPTCLTLLSSLIIIMTVFLISLSLILNYIFSSTDLATFYPSNSTVHFKLLYIYDFIHGRNSPFPLLPFPEIFYLFSRMIPSRFIALVTSAVCHLFMFISHVDMLFCEFTVQVSCPSFCCLPFCGFFSFSSRCVLIDWNHNRVQLS